VNNFFHTPPEYISSSSLQLVDEEFHHCVNVLRTKLGEIIFVLDGMGNCYEIELMKKGKRNVEGKIISVQENFHEPKIDLTLVVGLLKNSAKFDFIVEKATELGVKKIIPMISERTIAKSAKVKRLQKLALSAMKQCGRGFLPIISETTSLHEVIFSNINYDGKYISYEFALKNTYPAIANRKSKIVVVGSEGGFSENEIKQARENDFELLSLGERRLRTETAAIVICTKFLL